LEGRGAVNTFALGRGLILLEGIGRESEEIDEFSVIFVFNASSFLKPGTILSLKHF